MSAPEQPDAIEVEEMESAIAEAIGRAMVLRERDLTPPQSRQLEAVIQSLETAGEEARRFRGP